MLAHIYYKMKLGMSRLTFYTIGKGLCAIWIDAMHPYLSGYFKKTLHNLNLTRATRCVLRIKTK